MLINVSFVDAFQGCSSVVVRVYKDGELSESAKNSYGEIAKVSEKMSFSGKLFETVSFILAKENRKYVLLVGLGEHDKVFSNYELQKIGAEIYSCALKFQNSILAIGDEEVKGEKTETQAMILQH